MNTIRQPVHADAGASSPGDAEDHRFLCTVFRGTNVTAPFGCDGRPAGEPLATALTVLDERRGFVSALSHIYGADLTRGFDRMTCIRQIDVSPEFVTSREYRRQAIEELCRSTLDPAGLVIVRPAPGMWKPGSAARKSTDPRWNEALTLCHLFGSCGFAQLCDDALARPVPLFVRPWSRGQGLLRPRQPPRESFSRALCVYRVDDGRMILFDKGEAAVSPARGRAAESTLLA